ncbi:class I adenylate-forming enzyme family protein [Vagococcus sp. WN89Y]|uniref:class I adenylate-forming enzyme family protein n=1 Tax=Vagococcus sp. WN89Y TaxID=3457258 RepID=UPI003FCEC280
MIPLNKLKEIAILHGNEVCILDKNKSYTWNNVIKLVEERIVFLCRSYNKKQLRSVCYISKNTADLICWLSVFSTLGIPVNGLDYSLPVETLVKLLKRINPSILLISFKMYTCQEINTLMTDNITMFAIDSPSDRIIQSIGEFHSHELKELINGHKSVPERLVSLTSGTSSIPKIVYRYKSFESKRFNWFINRYKFTRSDGFMLILPLYHAAGYGWAKMFMLLGAPLYLVDQENEQMLLHTISQHSVKTTVLTPNIVSRLVVLAQGNKIKHSLRWVLVGGSYFSVITKRAAISIFGEIFYEYYGCTESGVNALSEPMDMLAYPESVGKAFEGNSIIILNDRNCPVKNGESGRIAVSSYMLMDEYSDGTRPFVQISGKDYFLMADFGYLDLDGRLFLLNRNGDTYNRYNLYTIEEKVRALPCIKDVAVVSSFKEGRHHIKCVFSTKKDHDVYILVDKIKKVVGEIGDSIFEVHAVNEVPYSPSGKVRFNAVFKMLAAA